MVVSTRRLGSALPSLELTADAPKKWHLWREKAANIITKYLQNNICFSFKSLGNVKQTQTNANYLYSLQGEKKPLDV